MKKLAILFLLLFSVSVAAQAPTKLFDVRNGGPTSTTIEYKDAASKQAVVDAFCELGSWTADLKDAQGNPVTRQQFFHRELQAIIRDRIRQARAQVAQKAVVVNDRDLP